MQLISKTVYANEVKSFKKKPVICRTTWYGGVGVENTKNRFVVPHTVYGFKEPRAYSGSSDGQGNRFRQSGEPQNTRRISRPLQCYDRYRNKTLDCKCLAIMKKKTLNITFCSVCGIDRIHKPGIVNSFQKMLSGLLSFAQELFEKSALTPCLQHRSLIHTKALDIFQRHKHVEGSLNFQNISKSIIVLSA